jgi:hypothetical protein
MACRLPLFASRSRVALGTKQSAHLFKEKYFDVHWLHASGQHSFVFPFQYTKQVITASKDL